MNKPKNDEKMSVRYLLGELSQKESGAFEEACFADDQCFAELLAIEAELTDEYVGGDLVGRRRERYEKRLLSTIEGKDNVEFARILTASYSTPLPPATTPFTAPDVRRFNWRVGSAGLDFRRIAFQMSLAALVLIFLAVALWLFWSSRQTRPHQDQAVQEPTPAEVRPQLSPQTPGQTADVTPQYSPQTPDQTAPLGSQAATTPELPRQLDNRKTAPAIDSPAIISLLIVPGFERSSGGANDLLISPQTRMVHLQLALEGDKYQSYSIVLRTVEGKNIFALNGLKARSTRLGSAVTLELPPSSFPPGDFILTLGGKTSQGEVEEVHKYFLSVTRK